MKPTTVFDLFATCTNAITRGVLIQQVSRTDKEFHFQNWFGARLEETGVLFDLRGRNAYPDFILVEYQEGYEVKGLAWPGRETTYDSNSQVPTGFHNGRAVFYVFGRYPPADQGEVEYPVIDLVICHGEFLNADHTYQHKNKSVKGFGSYGDIMIRDRKMYVARTPYSLADGLTGTHTLIVPATWTAPQGFRLVGALQRREAELLVVGYAFDLRTNTITPATVPNPTAGAIHSFHAYRLEGDSERSVHLVPRTSVAGQSEPDNEASE
jgi:hypothetical protein